MPTKKEIISRIERKAQDLIGKKYRYNPLMGFRRYKSWNVPMLLEFEELFLKDD